MKKLWYKKKSSLHGSGLFAVSNIKKGDQVIQYIGDNYPDLKNLGTAIYYDAIDS